MDEIGGIFPYQPSSDAPGKTYTGPGTGIFLDSGRSAFKLILAHLGQNKSKTILLPEYQCWESLYDPARELGFKIRLYAQTPEGHPEFTRVDFKDICAILLINYFGLVDQGPVITPVKRLYPHIRVILDLSQDLYGFLNFTPHESIDFAFCSFRKFLPVISGGALIPSPEMNDKKIFPSTRNPETWQYAFERASRVKRKMAGAEKQKKKALVPVLHNYLEQYKSRLAAQHRIQSIDAHSRQIIEQSPYFQIKARRIENYKWLVQNLSGNNNVIPLFKTLPDQSVPLCCPVVIPQKRNRLKSFLAANHIFCPVHWPKTYESRGVSISKAGKRTYETLLSLVIDQRYTIKHMKQILGHINDFYPTGI